MYYIINIIGTYLRAIGLMSRVFPVIPKKKMVLDATLFNTHHYKVRIKDKVEEFRK